MAINRAPFNALVDDDGSNLVGSIWNKAAIASVILDPADAAFAPTYGTWTPVDGSGAGLVFQSGTKGSYSKLDRLVFVWLQVVYPSTGSGAAASIAGLPYFVRVPVGASHGYGTLRIWWLVEGGKSINPLDANTVAGLTNAQMSGANIIISSVYLTD